MLLVPMLKEEDLVGAIVIGLGPRRGHVAAHHARELAQRARQGLCVYGAIARQYDALAKAALGPNRTRRVGGNDVNDPQPDIG